MCSRLGLPDWRPATLPDLSEAKDSRAVMQGRFERVPKRAEDSMNLQNPAF